LKTAKLVIPLLSVFVGTAAILAPAVNMEASDVEDPIPQPVHTSIRPTLDLPDPTAVPTQEATPTLAPTPVPAPTPTLDHVTHITVEHVLNQVMPWGVLVELYRWDSDPEAALILSVMAAESMGDPSIVSYAGACGVMQVIWKPWFGVFESELCNNSRTNIQVGIRILKGALNLAKERGLDERYGLAYYNCSIEGVHTDMCGSRGGLHYADKVLDFWLPRVRARIESCIEEYGEGFWGSRDGYDLPGCSW